MSGFSLCLAKTLSMSVSKRKLDMFFVALGFTLQLEIFQRDDLSRIL